MLEGGYKINTQKNAFDHAYEVEEKGYYIEYKAINHLSNIFCKMSQCNRSKARFLNKLCSYSSLLDTKKKTPMAPKIQKFQPQDHKLHSVS